MHSYCVNRNSQSNGDHEVHDVTANCRYLPYPENQISMGNFYSCHGAVVEARKYVDQVNGCYFCCNPCHTT